MDLNSYGVEEKTRLIRRRGHLNQIASGLPYSESRIRYAKAETEAFSEIHFHPHHKIQDTLKSLPETQWTLEALHGMVGLYLSYLFLKYS